MKKTFWTATLLVVFSATLVACGGDTSESAPPADVTPSTALTLRAKNIKFDKKVLATMAGEDVVITLDNQDSGTLHNLSLYKDSGAKEKVFVGDLFPGKKSWDYRFKAPGAGTYYFRCDAHPDMKGTLNVTDSSS
jgi:plastocyanin